jgi:polysaccharide biosynthesis protein PelD
MIASKRKIHLIEALFTPFVLFGINLLFPGNPGFASLFFLPFTIMAMFFASFNGTLYGFTALGVSIFLFSVPLPFLLDLIYRTGVSPEYWHQLLQVGMIGLPAAALLVYLFGMLRKQFAGALITIRNRYREMVKRNHRLSVQSRSLYQVYQELEERLSRQQESIMSLYNQVKRVDTVSVSAVLGVLLQTVQQFTKASSLSVWKHTPALGTMQLTAARGWGGEENREAEIPIEGSIEGWVVRNNKYFSVRMLLQFENLKRIDRGRNLITFPIEIGNSIWGVLNIEEMPFIKYNQYSERLLFIIISLLEPPLQKAIEYEDIIRKEEFDTLTGLPLFTSFYKMLSEDLKRKRTEGGTLTMMIIEIVNYPQLVGEFGKEKAHRFLPEIVKAVNEASGNAGQCFRYKEDNQLCFIFPNLDYDGASLYCLEILELMNSEGWEIEGQPVMLEGIIGFSSFTGTQSADELIDSAENLLAMQKV